MRSLSVPSPPSGARLSWSETAAYFALACLLDVAMGLPLVRQVLDGDLINPDSYMRLVRLREIVARHAFVNVVPRDGSGAGTELHWSHLVDGIILLLAAPLRAVMDGAQAVHWAAIALGPISVGLLGLSLAWVLAPLTDPGWRWTAPVLAGTSLTIVGYGIPGVVHHHILVALSIVITAGMAGRVGLGGARAGWLMGVSAAIGLWLSPETMPFMLAAWGAVGLAWLTDADRPGCGDALRNAGTSLLLITALGFALDPPEAGYGAVEIIRMSVVWLGLAAIVAAIGWSARALDRSRLTRAWRTGAAIAAVVAGMGVWFGMFPAVLRGPSGIMSPDEAKAYLSIINEMQPVTTWEGASAYLFGGGLATVIASIIAVRERSLRWAYAALCGVLIVALGASHVRFATYSAAFAAAMLPLTLSYCGSALARLPDATRMLARVGVAGLFFVVPKAGDLFALLSPARAADVAFAPDCSLRAISALLAPHAGEVVMANLSDTPELLYRTEVLTVGSLYNNIPAFMRLRDAWRSLPSDDLPETVKATGASLLLFCPDATAQRLRVVADLPPDTLLDRLDRHDVPRWLEELGQDTASGNVLYRIVGGGA
jgi:hypothetical protein